ncbi:MAG TPA: GNAT family N-acetyltransferase [Gammaproteobacteria bacterium]|nr:GNAT family N-acetyltransferase [Gammaproteobacteria bacterium]
MEIRLDDPRRPEIEALLREHLREMHGNSPPESVHALDVESLCDPGITFWAAWEGAELLGCGALLELDPGHGEIKSMRTAAAHLRKGVASQILVRIIEEAERRGYTRLSLETGSMPIFAPARALYGRFGFVYCEPFADYVLDPYSVFMTRTLPA